MKTLLKTFAAISLLFGEISISAAADDNIAACEIVVQQPIVSPDEEKAKKKTEERSEDADNLSSTPMIATFIPADDFVYSVFDGEDGHITEVDGHPIQALMCQRRYLIPTEFDLRLIETHIPLYLSQDFDSPESDLMAVYFKEDKYHYQYSGNDLSEDSLHILDVRMATLNSQEEK